MLKEPDKFNRTQEEFKLAEDWKLASAQINPIYRSRFISRYSYQTPGPGTYEVIQPNTNKRRMPAYTMNGRNYMPEDSTLKPGPGQHSPEKVQ